ncbi:hypothetical protein B0H37_001554 [Clostridium beijerinckii]|nr:hypothetical protein [Clostridium beijerinckii]NOV69566.1 hypothetical protein [Clostridium beijerinckii]NOW31525.1 hypothetical protein [Clostridium beijerinckii]
MMICKRCSRCGKRIQTGTICECQRNRHREYKKYRSDDKEQSFYSSKEWKIIKDKVKDKFKKIDIYSYYVLGELEYGQTAHHIEPLKDNWDRRLEIDNLIYLTESNHQKIHKAMEKDKKNKKQIMDMLYELIRRFEQEFKI